MLIPNIKNRGKKPIYECIYEYIKGEILSGKLKGGEKLPSRRQMALDNGVAEITVAGAYAQLLTEGYIESREKRGYFVLPQPVDNREQPEKKGVDAVNIRDRKKAYINSDKKKEDCSPGDIQNKSNHPGNNMTQASETCIRINLSDSSLPEDIFPFDTWSKLTRRILSMERVECIKAPSPQGLLDLRIAISDYLRDSRGFYADPEKIVIAPGTEYLNEMVLYLIGGVRFVAMEDPGYPAISTLYENSANKCLHIPVDKYGLITEGLEGQNIKLIHVSPSHHFPLGVIMSAPRRAELSAWAARADAWIVEDDYDSEFRFEGRPVPPFVSTYPDRVVYMNTFSRTLSPSIRMAYMVLPDSLYDIYVRKLSARSGAVSTLNQLTLRSFISEGYYERHINRMKNYYRKRKSAIKEIASDKLSDFFECEGDGSGMMFLLKPKAKKVIKKEETFLINLKKRGIILNSTGDYCYNRLVIPNNRYIVNFGSVTEDDFEEASHIICDVIKEL